MTETAVPVEVKETFVGFLNQLAIQPAGFQPVQNWEPALLAERDALHVRLLTPTREIRITAREGYLGCVAIARSDPTQVTELSDGPLTERTWATIMQEIVALELVTPYFITTLEGSASPP